MNFFEFYRINIEETKKIHTIVTLKINSLKRNKILNLNCYICEKKKFKEECSICHHKICSNCFFICYNCKKICCNFCNGSIDNFC